MHFICQLSTFFDVKNISMCRFQNGNNLRFASLCIVHCQLLFTNFKNISRFRSVAVFLFVKLIQRFQLHAVLL